MKTRRCTLDIEDSTVTMHDGTRWRTWTEPVGFRQWFRSVGCRQPTVFYCSNLERDLLILFGNYYRGINLSLVNGQIVQAYRGKAVIKE